MAFGLVPKFEQTVDLNGLSAEKYLAIALEAAQQLDWNVFNITGSGFGASIGKSAFSTREEFALTISGDTVTLSSKNASGGFLDLGRNRKHISKFIDTFEGIRASIPDSDLEAKAEALKPLEAAADNDAAPAAKQTFAIRSLFSLFVPKGGYFMTPVIIDLNIAVFVIMVLTGVSAIDPGTDSLILWGANLRELTLAGQWWRLITNVFLHIGILHILFNMYALLYIGVLLEPYLGRARFAVAYLVTGIIASLTSIAVHPNTVSAGASGAIFGMYGVFLALMTTSIIDKTTRAALFMSIGVFVFYNLVNGVKEGIDNAAHVGGLASGIIIGYAYVPGIRRPESKNIQYLTFGLLIAAACLTSVVIYSGIPNDIAQYDKKMETFSKNEQAALEFYHVKNLTDSVALKLIRTKGLPNWDANLKILDEADKLDLPVELKNRVAALRRYCKLRVKSYNLIYLAVKENNDAKYQASIDSCNKVVGSMIDSLKKS